MGKFKLTKRIELGFVGKGWENCYLEFYQITFAQLSKIAGTSVLEEDNNMSPQVSAKMAIDLLEEHFISGKAISISGKEVDVKKEDLKEFPVLVINEAVDQLSGAVKKKD